MEESLAEWLKLGGVQKSDSLYNSPVFCVPKKGGNGYRIVQDFRELNQKSLMDKYTMKDIHECIGDIGRSESTIFSTLDLTNGKSDGWKGAVVAERSSELTLIA